MTTANWFLHLLERAGRHRVIFDRSGKDPYMHRYYLIFKDKIQEFDKSRELPFNAFLHHIVQSDEDDLHDHPWWYFTLILSGGYWEETPEGVFWRGPGHMRVSSPTSLHKLKLGDKDVGAWTLFVRGPKIRDWGFLRSEDNIWEHWRTYLASRYEKNKGTD